MRKLAKVRVCACCEWVFIGGVECPKCQFGSYGAHRVYGPRAYTYLKTQQPWRDKKPARYASEPDKEILIAGVEKCQ